MLQKYDKKVKFISNSEPVSLKLYYNNLIVGLAVFLCPFLFLFVLFKNHFIFPKN